MAPVTGAIHLSALSDANLSGIACQISLSRYPPVGAPLRREQRFACFCEALHLGAVKRLPSVGLSDGDSKNEFRASKSALVWTGAAAIAGDFFMVYVA